jgi:ubiquinone/menaquinone biosynthesis C-methylase UbiE
MAEIATRVRGLSPDRQQLLRRLVEERMGGAASRQAVVSKPRAGLRRLERASTHELGAKDVCRRFYDVVTEQLDASPFGELSFFLNYGYVANLNPQYSAIALTSAMPNRNSVQLALEVVEDCIGAGMRVLDIGCGRGGTISVIRQYFDPARVVGLDLSGAAVAFCRRTHGGAAVGFLQGDAENLPFPDGAFDIVTNIESSSCYPNLFSFFAEVYRVLVVGGRFLYADCLPSERFSEGVQRLQRMGFTIERARDITTNVLASCDQIAAARLGAYSGDNDSAAMRDFLGAPGSQYYEQMRARRWLYQIFKLRKGVALSSPPGRYEQ